MHPLSLVSTHISSSSLTFLFRNFRSLKFNRPSARYCKMKTFPAHSNLRLSTRPQIIVEYFCFLDLRSWSVWCIFYYRYTYYIKRKKKTICPIKYVNVIIKRLHITFTFNLHIELMVSKCFVLISVIIVVEFINFTNSIFRT